LKSIKNVYLTLANRFVFNSMLLNNPDIRRKKHDLDTCGHLWTASGHFKDVRKAYISGGWTLGHFWTPFSLSFAKNFSRRGKP
jgi:hypothetical protein